MPDCPNGLIRDQLPEYVHGVLPADVAARVDAHLDACAACRAEVALLGNVRAALASFTPGVDVASIVAALPAPRGTPRVTARRKPRRFAVSAAWQYAAAAALVLAVGSSVLWRSVPGGADEQFADSSSAVAVPETTASVSPAPRQSEVGITFGGGLSDLSLDDLQSLLGQMDSVRTLPSSNPASMTPVIALKEGGKSL